MKVYWINAKPYKAHSLIEAMFDAGFVINMG